MGHISFVGKLDARCAARRRAGHRARIHARAHGKALARLLADLGRSAGPGQSRHSRSQRQHRSQLQAEQRRRPQAPAPKLKELMKQQTACPVHGHECHQGLFARNLFVGDRIPLAGVAHQNGTIRFGRDPQDFRARRPLQGPRARQPLRRGRQLLPVQRRRESGAHDHGQCPPSRGSPDRKDEVACGAHSCPSFSSAAH